MAERPEYLPTDEEIKADIEEYGPGVIAIARASNVRTARKIAEWQDDWIHDGEVGAKYVVEQFIREATEGAPQGKGESDA